MTAKPVDPFDVDALRAAAPTVDTIETELLVVKARKPTRRDFFRVNPNPAYVVDAVVVKFEGDDGEAFYFVPPHLRGAVPPEEALPVRIFTCMNRHGVLFLWPCRLPAADGPGRSWHQSALKAAEMAKEAWVKMVGNRHSGGYEVSRATGDFGEPEWSSEPLGSLLKKAFDGEFLIDSPDHDVLRRIRGEI